MNDQRPREASRCPSSARLAELVDGRLEGRELAAVLEHLDRCDDCREVVASSVELLEGESLPHRDRTSTHPRARAWTRLVLPLAAVLVLGVALVWRFDPGTPGPMSVGMLAESIGAPPGNWHLHGWSVTRGGSGTDAERRRAFRAGVRVVDLELALRQGQLDRAGRLAAGLARELEAHEGGEAAVFVYRELGDRLTGEPVELDELLDLVASGDELLVELLPSADYRLGRWAEAGRLSSLTNGDLVRRSEFRRELEHLLDADPSVADRALLEEVEKRLSSGDVEEPLTRLIDSR